VTRAVPRRLLADVEASVEHVAALERDLARARATRDRRIVRAMARGASC
jgi:hypothetical protein